MIDEKYLAEFKRIYKEGFGEELSNQEAMEKATNFLNLMRVVSRPIPKGVIVNGEAT